GIQQFTEQAKWNLIAAHDAIIEKCVKQTHFANRHRREPPIVRGRLQISAWNLSVRNYLLHNNKYTIGLELPPELMACWIHPMFHMKLIHSYFENDDKQFLNREVSALYKLGANDEQEWFINEIIGH
ncbi:hypothetical protein M422DRAFT_93283, partial [Sphaerobolus stellatus SS14]